MPDKPEMRVYMPRKQDMTEFEEHIKACVVSAVENNKPKWWQPTPTQIVTILVVVIGYGVTLGKTDSRITTTETSLALHDGLIKVIRERNEEIEKQAIVDHSTIIAQEARLSRLEDVNEKLAIIATKMEQTSHDLVEVKSQVNSLSTAFTGFQIDFNSTRKK